MIISNADLSGADLSQSLAINVRGFDVWFNELTNFYNLLSGAPGIIDYTKSNQPKSALSIGELSRELRSRGYHDYTKIISSLKSKW
jgi:hypothetical protein